MRNSEQDGSRRRIVATGHHAHQLRAGKGSGRVCTLVNLHICQCSPFIHCHHPFPVGPSAAQVDDELFDITIDGFDDRTQTIRGELCVWKEVRRYNDLLNRLIRLLLHSSIARYSCHTFSAPRSIQSLALSAVIPPPTCNPPCHVSRAS